MDTTEIVLNDDKLNQANLDLQKLEEKARKAEEALAAEEKVRKELEGLNAKLLAEKTALLDSLAGEKGSLQDFQEKTAKLTAQKNDLDNQLRVSTFIYNQEDKKSKKISKPPYLQYPSYKLAFIINM